MVQYKFKNFPKFHQSPNEMQLENIKMVKTKSNKMHLEINNDLELDINNASISRRNRKSKKTFSSPIKRIKRFPTT